MSRLQPIDPSTATGKAKELLDAVKGKLGLVPNMTRVMAVSPAVLESYLGFSGALAGGLLDAKTREQLALLTAQENHCDYCLSAHTAIGKMVGLNHEQIVASREGDGGDPKTTAGLTFAKRVLETKGQILVADLVAVRGAGFSEGEIAEVIAHVALNVFTNYFNVATNVDIDFPRVSYTEAA
ncbi:carboxymuconolactone decarboxylase family protein [Granulicella sp. dw_53]|uniref:carboxymuconolactone decarboxylase family protein n=1 Tax=Granulicella sp. dw_53 TaxID=2719792 RepID=UPI001BD4BE52|nr:carboxymuconolactone decarboxylase family protein [Granulicella sp. dw_53]